MEPLAYDFVADADDTTFRFATVHALTYEVRFTPSGYLFLKYAELNDYTFELVIKLVANATGSRTPPDRRIVATIAVIFSAFLEQNKRVIVYICDTSDKRQTVRARKFNGWFEQYQSTTGLYKVDQTIMDAQGVIYLMSLITRTDNPLRRQAFDAFDELITGENDKP
jgi:hypothetical protein